MDEFPVSDFDPVRNMEENCQEDCLPFFLDDDSSGPEGSPSFLRRRSSVKSTYGFSLDPKVGRKEAASATSNNVKPTSGLGSVTDNLESTSSRLDSRRHSNRTTDPLTSTDLRSDTRSRGSTKNPNILFFLIFSSYQSIYVFSRFSMS